MSSSVIIFLFGGLANVMKFMTGYFFMKCMDCTMKRRNGKFAFCLSLLLYTIVSTLVVFPKDMTNISMALLLFLLINFTFLNIDIDKMLSIDDVSLCTIFSNTLDNAIEACKKIDDPAKRKLELRCRYTENGYFSFELTNSKVNEIHKKKGRFLSDKEDQNAHGIGIASVKEIVDNYEGTLDISYDKEWFKVVILIG